MCVRRRSTKYLSAHTAWPQQGRALLLLPPGGPPACAHMWYTDSTMEGASEVSVLRRKVAHRSSLHGVRKTRFLAGRIVTGSGRW